jgi:hypothetical protein
MVIKSLDETVGQGVATGMPPDALRGPSTRTRPSW